MEELQARIKSNESDRASLVQKANERGRMAFELKKKLQAANQKLEEVTKNTDANNDAASVSWSGYAWLYHDIHPFLYRRLRWPSWLNKRKPSRLKSRISMQNPRAKRKPLRRKSRISLQSSKTTASSLAMPRKRRQNLIKRLRHSLH